MLRTIWQRLSTTVSTFCGQSGIQAQFLQREPRRGAPYRQQFEEAVGFTRALGCSVEPVHWTEASVLEERVDPATIERVLRAARIEDLSQSAVQCIKWSAYIRPYLEEEIGSPVWLTIGQLWRKGKPIYGPSWQVLDRWHKEGFGMADFGESGTGFQLHAWLTLSSGEILDFTLLSSLAAFVPQTWLPMAGSVIGGYPTHAFEGHEFVPMVVGDDYAIRLNAKSPLPILARTSDDLAAVPVAAILHPI
jgi:hypothetical protein